MPRREKPHPFAIRVGRRIRSLRREAGLTIEKLAYESDLGSKGHLSSLERGLVLPTVETIRVIAERLGVLPLDLVTFPEDSAREKLIDRTRKASRKEIEAALAHLPRSGS
jgi:transcriptional regulator with XRE-family HTH domain